MGEGAHEEVRGVADDRQWSWKLWLKIGVTVSLLAVLAWQVDWHRLGQALTSADLALVGCVVLLMMLSVTISAYKWQQLLSVHGIEAGLILLHRWYFIAAFLNNFLPTSIGGDGFRIYKTLDSRRPNSCAVSAVLTERISGIVVLVMMAYAAALILWLQGGPELTRWFVLASTAGGVLALVSIGLRQMFDLPGQLAEKLGLAAALDTMHKRMGDYLDRPLRSSWALGGVSLLFHVHTVFFYWLLFLSMGETVDPVVLIVVLAITAVVSVVPISLNGIGVVEGAFVWTAVQFDITYEVALSAIMIVRGIKLLQSGVGAGLYAYGSRDLDEVAPTDDRSVSEVPLST